MTGFLSLFLLLVELALLVTYRWDDGVRGVDIGFVWDEDKYREVQNEHQVRFYEAVSAFDDPDGYEVPDPTGHEDRWMWVGSTAGGRILAVVYSEEAWPLYRLITAFDATGRRLDEYRERV